MACCRIAVTIKVYIEGIGSECRIVFAKSIVIEGLIPGRGIVSARAVADECVRSD